MAMSRKGVSELYRSFPGFLFPLPTSLARRANCPPSTMLSPRSEGAPLRARHRTVARSFANHSGFLTATLPSLTIILMSRKASSPFRGFAPRTTKSASSPIVIAPVRF